MGLLPRRRTPDRGKKGREADERHGVYRVEVDTEKRHFPSQTAFSFWSAVKYIFVLSLLLWWLPQNIGAMIAGYVGGRRAGSHFKAVAAALLPVVVLYVGQWLGEHGIGGDVIGSVAGFPGYLASALAVALPPAQPYVEFVGAYLATFVVALQTTFGMQANGYLIVVVFAYIGGIVGEQGRREMGEEVPAPSIHIVQPVVEHLRHRGHEDREPLPRWYDRRALPDAVGAARRRQRPGRRWLSGGSRGRPDRLSEYRRVSAEVVRSGRLPTRVTRREPEVVRGPPAPLPRRDRDRDLATQRFVERALRQYERPHRRAY